MAVAPSERSASPDGPVLAALLQVDGLTVRFGGVTALDGVTFAIPTGGICGLIGPNGAGKTTLFDCVSRLNDPQEGRITYGDGIDLLRRQTHEIAGLGIARTFQHVGLFGSLTVRDNVMLGGHATARPGFVSSALRLPVVRRNDRALADRADHVLDQLGLTSLAYRPAAGMPYGTLKRIELARALCGEPRLLMLDEPAGGLSHSEVDELAGLIDRIRRENDLTVLLVEHHMGMVMRLSQQVVVLEFGKILAIGTPDEVRADPAVVAAYLGAPA